MHVWVLSVALAITALLNWSSVLRGDYVVERITKPTFMLLLIGLAWSLHADSPPAGAPDLMPLLVGLGLSTLGDVLLLTATEVRFRLGLLAFLGAHVAYVWTLLTVPSRAGFPWLVLPAALVVLYIYGRFGRHVVAGAGGDRLAVFVYVLALGTLLVAAAAKADWVVIAGCFLFLVSDTILGHDRFVHERRWAPWAVIVTYHAAQVLIVVGLLR